MPFGPQNFILMNFFVYNEQKQDMVLIVKSINPIQKNYCNFWANLL